MAPFVINETIEDIQENEKEIFMDVPIDCDGVPDSDNDGWCDDIDPCPNDPNCPVNHDPNPTPTPSPTTPPPTNPPTPSPTTPPPDPNDPYGDGLSNFQEGKLGTDPNDPDTDNDGFWDGDDECPLTYGGTSARTDVYVTQHSQKNGKRKKMKSEKILNFMKRKNQSSNI